MKKRIVVLACSVSLVLAFGACKKKEEQPSPVTGMPGQQQQLPPGHPQPGAMPGQPGMQPGMAGQPGNVVMPKGEVTVEVPSSVKGKWKAVVLEVTNKKTNKSSDYTVNLNSDLKIPNSDLKVAVGEFLPDFRMEGLKLTSVSDQPNNPAVGIRVYEGGKQIFPAEGKKWGWLYERPELHNIHPFQHAEYTIFLKQGIKKG
jgi:hypothetical protein